MGRAGHLIHDPRPYVHADLTVHAVGHDAPERASVEAALAAAQVPLPLEYRVAAARACGVAESRLLVVRDGAQRPVGCLMAVVRRLRVLPAHVTLHVPQLGESLPAQALDAGLGALVQWVHAERRVLRLTVATFSADATHRTALAERLGALGFSPSEDQSAYERTLRLDLLRDDPVIFAGLHASARRNIRDAAKRPVRLETITDGALVPRMQRLLHEAMHRTGGRTHEADWEARIALGASHPELSRLVGVMRTDRAGPEALIGFAWGCRHGDHAVYADSGSTRVTDMRIGVGYPMIWDLVLWAKRTGARWLDLGGVTVRDGPVEDPLAGISDFKRLFSEEMLEVGQTWRLRPHTLRARLAHGAHRLWHR